MKLTLVLLVCLLFGLTLILSRSFWPQPSLLSPLAVNSPSPAPTPAYSPQIWGFLPYWNLNQFDPQALSHLTDLAYFSLTVDATGQWLNQDIGYRRFLANYFSLAQLCQTHHLKFHLVIKAESDQALFDLLHHPTAQARLNSAITQLTAAYPLHGLNLDFEPSTATDAATINAFTVFVQKLKTENSKLKISIDIYPSAASSPKLWDLASLKTASDYFIIMAYDYTQANSLAAGPIAPLYPSPLSRHAIMPNLQEITQLVAPHQLLLGLPLYGYEWSTLDTSLYAPARRSGQLATLQRLSRHLPVSLILTNPQTLSSRLVLTSDDAVSQIYFDDLAAFTHKAALVKNGGLRGVALWAIGYEGPVDIWSALAAGFN
ncbi:hypothetical protein A2W24_06360 [Microgenomates group bacterium RBG_16_45_19]|nr:MAG: hypothetical protein A2W24_06360 [Microgenomates group bacterium RBG_16_45_19]